jgi:high-affinity iron transporter
MRLSFNGMGVQAFLAAVIVSSLTRFAPPSASQGPSGAQAAALRVVATVHLAAQEYALAFERGALVHPEEAAEAKLFLAEARRAAATLPSDVAPRVRRAVDALAALVAAAAPADSVARGAAALLASLRSQTGTADGERPPRAPSFDAGERIYASRCARCHGGGGRGDGPDGRGLVPPPADLVSGLANGATTPLDAYRRITYGVPGTAMPAFGPQLTRAERWDAIAYALTLSDTLARATGSGAAAVAFASVRGTLRQAMNLARRGARADAAGTVLDAYLTFEGVEGAVRVANAPLASRAEVRFSALREAAGAGSPSLEAHDRAVLATLDSAEAELGRSKTGWGYLAESFLLIVREGFEAILIIAAIVAVVQRSGNAGQGRGIRWGVALALLASLATAAGLDRLLPWGGAQREALEGGVMLVAAAVLFYVSYWLISKVEAATWQRFLREKVERAATSGRSLALASVAFLAVYREGFETVLFYKALYLTGGAAAAAPISVGLAAGGVVLVAVYLGIERFGIRIPLRPFFAVTGATLYFMAFVFAGTGVKELQEGALIRSTLIPGAPRSDFFGVYPTVESLAVQGVLVACLVLAVAWKLVARRRAAAAARREAGLATPSAPQTR